MPDEQVSTTAATPGADPAASPTATEPTEAKTPEQLAAEQDAAEAKQKEEAAEREEEERVKRKPWFQKRIDELTRKRGDEERARIRAEAERDAMRQLIERYGKPPEQPKPQEPAFQPTRPAPTREQFEFDEEKYIAATVQWHLEQERSKADVTRRTEETQRNQREFATTVEQRRQQTMTQGAEKYPDFDSVVGAIPANIMDPHMAIAVLECEHAADVAYHLGKNRELAEQIAKLPPMKRAIALGRIEAGFATAATKPTTKAPPPPTPVGGREKAKVSPDDLPMDEYYRQYQARRRGA